MMVAPSRNVARWPCGKAKAPALPSSKGSIGPSYWSETRSVPPLDQASTTTMPPGKDTTTHCSGRTEASPKTCTSQ